MRQTEVDAHLDGLESDRARLRSCLLDDCVAFDDAEVAHLALRLRSQRVLGARLRHHADPAGAQHARELGEDLGGIRHVMERVVARDAVDRFVRELQAVAVEVQ